MDRLLASQRAYYRARAPEYDAWFLRQGRYDWGEAHRAQWFGEVEVLENALADFAPRGDILELACGTGWWTEKLVRYGDSLTAVDASAEVLALNRVRLAPKSTKTKGAKTKGTKTKVKYVQADLFEWQPQRAYDTIFFSFWLSHVPPERFESFWNTVKKSLNPGGRVFFIDSSYASAGTARDHTPGSSDATTVTRRLDDGRTFDIVKVFYEPAQLEAKLAALGWRSNVGQTAMFFVYGGVTAL